MSAEALLAIIVAQLCVLPVVLAWAFKAGVTRLIVAIREEVIQPWQELPHPINVAPTCGHGGVTTHRHTTGATSCEQCARDGGYL